MKKIYLLLLSFFFLIFNLSSQTVSDSLQIHYNFDGNFLDHTPTNLHLQYYNGSSLGFETSYNNFADSAITFDGTAGLQSINSFSTSTYTEMSISFWMKSIHLNNQEHQFILQGANIGFGIFVASSTNKLGVFFDGNSPGSLISINPVSDNSWHHIVAQSNGSITYIYIDGVLDRSQSEIMSVGNNNSNNKVHIGRAKIGFADYIGALDEVRIYNRILSQAEIDTLSNPSLLTSIKEIKHTFNLTVYPNPTTEKVNFYADQSLLNANLRLKNIVGQEVFQSQINTIGNNEIQVNYDKGIYFLEVTKTNGEKSISKIIKH